MADQTQEARGRLGRRGRVLAAVLALAMLVPLGLLFLGNQRHLSEHRATAAQERDGIEYLLALSELTTALTDAQSAAVRGEQVSRDALDRALADVAEVDERYGDELRARERYSQLRDRIERATGSGHADGRAAFAAYAEATSLLLGLHARVRETSGLVRDPDADAFHLQDAAGGHLPETTVAVGRLVDRLTLAAEDPARGRDGGPAADSAEVRAATREVAHHSEELVTGVQSALDSTESRSLSSAVLSKYDRFLRAKDGLLATVPPDGDIENVDMGLIAMFRGELRAAGDDLYTTLLVELDTLIDIRAGELARDLWVAVVSAVVGVLLVAAVAVLTLLRSVGPRGEGPIVGHLSGGGGHELGGGSGPDNGREPHRHRTPISDTAASARARPGGSPAGDLLTSERVDAR